MKNFDPSRREFLRLGGAAAASFTVAASPFAALAQVVGMKIGVVGSGRLGGAVGTLWIKAGHEVLFSSRHPGELKPLVDGLGPRARAGTVQEAVNFGDVILVAVPYSALPQIGRDFGSVLSTKIVIDASNPIPARDGEIVKEAQEMGPGATSEKYLGKHLVRTFNSVGTGNLLSQSNRPGEKIGIPFGGDDPDAVRVAFQLVRDAGFEPVVVPLARSKEWAPGTPLFGKALPVSEVRRGLGLAQ
jgi:8-hydroxy-5-deazaflavin:NADPH oxidoreductase